MRSILLSAIDQAALTFLACRRPRLLRETTAPPDEPFAERMQRWTDADCVLEAEEETPRGTHYRATISAVGQTFPMSLYYHRAPNPPRDGRRLIVYHHGLGEWPVWRSFDGLIAARPELSTADRILLIGLGHEPRARSFRRLLTRLEGFETFLACSAIMAKHVIDRFGADYRRVVLAGLSIGGIVSLIETLYEPRYHANVSILGSPFLAALLLRSSFTRLVDSRFRARVRYNELRPRIDLDGLVAANGRPVIMINGRYDTMVDIDLLRRWWERQPAVEHHELDVSHMSGVIFPTALRRLVGEVLRRELGLSPGVAAAPATT
jgi:pimeloyl-ACP methyl ester carboxylesterase